MVNVDQALMHLKIMTKDDKNCEEAIKVIEEELNKHKNVETKPFHICEITTSETYEPDSYYLKEKTCIAKDSTKLDILNNNLKEIKRNYILSHITGEEQKVFLRVRNPNPLGRKDFLSKVKVCSKIVIDPDNEERVIFYIQRGPFYRDMISTRRIKDYGVKWAFKKEDFVIVL